MTEYEYSFKVKDLKPYIDYCKLNGYELIEESSQKRTLCRHDNKTMARITIKGKNGIIKKELDFKDDILTDDVLIERRESKAIVFDDDEAVDSVLEYLGYRKDTILLRERIVYKKNNVVFELDNYESPDKALVVAIEGEKEAVDKIYLEIKPDKQ